MLLFFGLLYAALSFSPRPATVAGGALVLKLDGAIVEQPQPQHPLDLVAGSNSILRAFRLRDVIHAIETAADDQKVTAIVLALDNLMGGRQAALSSVREALDAARPEQKPALPFATASTR